MRLFVLLYLYVSFVLIFVTVKAAVSIVDYRSSEAPSHSQVALVQEAPNNKVELKSPLKKDIYSEVSEPNHDLTVVSGGTWTFDHNEIKLTNPISWNIAVTNIPVKADFSVNFNGEQAFVVLAYGDSNNYYYVTLNEYDVSPPGIYKVHDGHASLLTNFTLPHTGENKIEVEQKPGKITIRLDGELVGSYEDTDFLPGIIGFGSAGSDAMFTEPELTELTKDKEH